MRDHQSYASMYDVYTRDRLCPGYFCVAPQQPQAGNLQAVSGKKEWLPVSRTFKERLWLVERDKETAPLQECAWNSFWRVAERVSMSAISGVPAMDKIRFYGFVVP